MYGHNNGRGESGPEDRKWGGEQEVQRGQEVGWRRAGSMLSPVLSLSVDLGASV